MEDERQLHAKADVSDAPDLTLVAPPPSLHHHYREHNGGVLRAEVNRRACHCPVGLVGVVFSSLELMRMQTQPLTHARPGRRPPQLR